MLGAKRYFATISEWFLPLLMKNPFIAQGGLGAHERFIRAASRRKITIPLLPQARAQRSGAP